MLIRCEINDIIENKQFKLKFRIDALKRLFTLNKQIGSKFIKVYSEINSKEFLISPFESNFVNKNKKDIGYLYRKFGNNILINIGKRIDNILVFSDFNRDTKKRGLMIKYTNGDICRENISRKYQSYLFITCNKENNKPKLIRKLNSNIIFIQNAPIYLNGLTVQVALNV